MSRATVLELRTHKLQQVGWSVRTHSVDAHAVEHVENILR